MKSYLARVKEAVERANWRKGYGTIVVCQVFADGTIRAKIRRPFSNDVMRRGHIDGNRVRFAGTTAVIKD